VELYVKYRFSRRLLDSAGSNNNNVYISELLTKFSSYIRL